MNYGVWRFEKGLFFCCFTFSFFFRCFCGILYLLAASVRLLLIMFVIGLHNLEMNFSKQRTDIT